MKNMNKKPTLTSEEKRALLQRIAEKAATLEEARRIIDKAEKEAEKKLADPSTSEKLRRQIMSSLQALKVASDFIDKLTQGRATKADKIQALQAVKISHHTSEKIEDADSVDSCSSCDFCEKASHCPRWICQKCYARRMNKRYICTFIRHAANCAVLMSCLFKSDELAALQASALIVRINSDGETPNTIYAINLLRWAKRPENRARKVAYWYKNTPALREAIQVEGKPANVIFVQSSPIIDEEQEWDGISDIIFTVYSTEEKVTEAVKKGARRCNGIKCKVCGWQCYFHQKKHSEQPVKVAELARG